MPCVIRVPANLSEPHPGVNPLRLVGHNTLNFSRRLSGFIPLELVGVPPITQVLAESRLA